MSGLKMNKTAISVISLHEQDPVKETRYWLTKTVDERLEALEHLRQMMYGYDPLTTRFRGALATVERKRG